ncbi:MAG: hypothetical protein Q4D86_07030 [Pasteurella oralis]|uniref:hypothetical protein n=1 Tax=Pasteurella oralis TaxID=1071947 RepID=UPI002711C2D7|nr:hypothetical protein [Pasteurella oralis]
MKKSLIKMSLAATLSALLIACGGGGGGGGNNSGNQAQPIQPAPQPAPEPPKKDNQAGNADNQPQNPPPKNDPKQPERDQLEAGQWKGQCYSGAFCTKSDEASNMVTVYELTLKQDAMPGSSTPDKLEVKEQKITLTPGNNKGDEYQFTLLGSEDAHIGYYGYRNTVGNSPDSRRVEVLYAINSEFKSKDQQPKMKAYYKKERGFIYSPVDSSNSNIKSYGDVDLVYDEGKLSGSIYSSYESTAIDRQEIFHIKTTNGTTTIEPKDQLQGTIKAGDKTVLNHAFADSTKNGGDHKYLFGSARAETWSGILFGEKQQEKPADKPKP